MMFDIDINDYYTTAQIRDALGITTAGVRIAIKRKTLIEGVDCIKVAKTWFVKKEVAHRLWG